MLSAVILILVAVLVIVLILIAILAVVLVTVLIVILVVHNKFLRMFVLRHCRYSSMRRNL